MTRRLLEFPVWNTSPQPFDGRWVECSYHFVGARQLIEICWRYIDEPPPPLPSYAEYLDEQVKRTMDTLLETIPPDKRVKVTIER